MPRGKQINSMVDVECKCPYSGKIHTVKMKSKPLVMPRIFHPDYAYLRNDANEGSGYLKRESIKSHREGA